MKGPRHRPRKQAIQYASDVLLGTGLPAFAGNDRVIPDHSAIGSVDTISMPKPASPT